MFFFRRAQTAIKRHVFEIWVKDANAKDMWYRKASPDFSGWFYHVYTEEVVIK